MKALTEIFLQRTVPLRHLLYEVTFYVLMEIQICHQIIVNNWVPLAD